MFIISVLLLQSVTNTIGVVTFLTTMFFSDWDVDSLGVEGFTFQIKNV